MDFNLHTIPTGEYQIGMDENDPLALELEKPRLPCLLTQFSISDLITIAQWQKFVKDSMYEAEGERYLDAGSPTGAEAFHKTPVTGVSKHDVDMFCQFYGVRLPTEAQWEVAATELGFELGKYWEWTDEVFVPERGLILAEKVEQGGPVTDPYFPYPSPEMVQGLEKYWTSIGSLRGCGSKWIRFGNLYRYPLSKHVARRHECPVDARTPMVGFRVAVWQRPMNTWQEELEEGLFQ